MVYEAAIVLGNGDGISGLTAQSINRVETALDGYRTCSIDKICLSGMASPEMLRYLEERKIPYQNLFLEDNSLDTVGNALFTKINFAIPEDWRRILVVSSNYHLQRVEEIFKFVYGKEGFNLYFRGAPCSDKRSEEEEWESLRAFKQTFEDVESGDDKAIARRLFESHQLYRERDDLRQKLNLNF